MSVYGQLMTELRRYKIQTVSGYNEAILLNQKVDLHSSKLWIVVCLLVKNLKSEKKHTEFGIIHYNLWNSRATYLIMSSTSENIKLKRPSVVLPDTWKLKHCTNDIKTRIRWSSFIILKLSFLLKDLPLLFGSVFSWNTWPGRQCSYHQIL